VPSASYERLNRVEPYVGTCGRCPLRRVAAEKDFGYLAGDVARMRKTLATKSVSLNEAERREELAQDKARHLPPPIVRTTPVDKASSADDITLDEAERVLSDYVGLLS
jgi:hypothetical protein